MHGTPSDPAWNTGRLPPGEKRKPATPDLHSIQLIRIRVWLLNCATGRSCSADERQRILAALGDPPGGLLFQFAGDQVAVLPDECFRLAHPRLDHAIDKA